MSGQLPSQHEKQRIAQEAQRQLQDEDRKRQDAKLRQAVDWLLKAEPGRIFWAYLYNLCGYNQSSISHFAAGDIAPLKTEAKEAQRLIYITLRRLAVPEILAKAEFEAEFGVKEQEAKPQKGDKKDGKAR